MLDRKTTAKPTHQVLGIILPTPVLPCLKEILDNPHVTSVTRKHARFGDVLEYRLPSGQGARFSSDGKKIIGFIE